MLNFSLTLGFKFLLVILGWFGWNFFEFSEEKDKYDDRDEAFPYKKWLGKTWDNIVLSFIFATIFLLTGSQFFHIIDPFDGKIGWNDAFYAGSGLLGEIAAQKLKQWRKKKTE